MPRSAADPGDALQWQLGPVQLRFSMRDDGDMRTRAMRRAYAARYGLGDPAVPRQVHGIVVRPAAEADAGEADALVQVVEHAVPAPPLGVLGADCPGLCVVAPGRTATAIGLAHCGWRGTAGGIVAALIAAMREQVTQIGDAPATWLAFIGPGISPACYEVDAPVLTARTWPAAALRPGRDAAHAQLDLAAAIRCDLLALGIDQVASCARCTASDPRLSSFRRAQAAGHPGPVPVQMLLAACAPVPGGHAHA